MLTIMLEAMFSAKCLFNFDSSQRFDGVDIDLVERLAVMKINLSCNIPQISS